MNEKEIKILKIIIDYYNLNKLMPSIRYLQKEMNAKSTNSIYYYIKKLEEKGYLIRNSSNKQILDNDYKDFFNGLKVIKILNTDENVKLILNDNKDYVAYKVDKDIFDIKKNDILIIEKTKKLKNNDIGLFKFNKRYAIMKYYYKDGFYILENDTKRFYNNVNIIGKVIYLERKIKRDKSLS